MPWLKGLLARKVWVCLRVLMSGLMVSWFMKRWSEKETVFSTGTRTVVTDFTRHVTLLDWSYVA